MVYSLGGVTSEVPAKNLSNLLEAVTVPDWTDLETGMTNLQLQVGHDADKHNTSALETQSRPKVFGRVEECDTGSSIAQLQL